MTKRTIRFIYIAAIIVIIAGVCTLIASTAMEEKNTDGIEMKPDFDPAVLFKEDIAWFEEDGYSFFTDKYWGDAYMMVFQKPWIAQHPNIIYSPEDCAACSSKLGIALYKKSKNKWEAKYVVSGLIKAGGYGELKSGEIQPIQLSKKTYGILVSDYLEIKNYYSLKKITCIQIALDNEAVLFEIPLHYDNFADLGEEKGFSVDISLLPKWDEETKTTSIYLSLTQKGEPSLRRDFYFTKILKTFGNQKHLRLIYKDGRYRKG